MMPEANREYPERASNLAAHPRPSPTNSTPRPLSKRMIEAIRHALKSAGVEFVGENGGGPGGCAAKFEARSGIHGWLLASSTRAISAAPELVWRNIA